MKIVEEILKSLLIVFAFAYLDSIYEIVSNKKSKTHNAVIFIIGVYTIIKIALVLNVF